MKRDVAPQIRAPAVLAAAGLLAACGLDPLRSSDLRSPGDGGTPPTASLAGIVRDAKNGAPLVDATVLVAGVSVPTDAGGAYFFEGLATGPAGGSVALAGYESAAFEIVLAPGPNRRDVSLVPIPCDVTGCRPEEFCSVSTGRCVNRAGVAELSGAVHDACDGRALVARVTIAGRSTCSTAGGKAFFRLEGLPAGGPQALTAARPGYLPYLVAITLREGFNVEEIRLDRPGGCAAPPPMEADPPCP